MKDKYFSVFIIFAIGIFLGIVGVLARLFNIPGHAPVLLLALISNVVAFILLIIKLTKSNKREF